MFKKIVVGTDGSETAGLAVRQAAELARAAGAELTITSAYEPVSPVRLRQEEMDAPSDVAFKISPREDVEALLQEAAGAVRDIVKAKTLPLKGDPADALIDAVEETGADLIVVGNKGMTGAKRFLLGSVPNKIAHHSGTSVLIIKTT